MVKVGLAIIACLAAILGVALALIFAQITNARVEVASLGVELGSVKRGLPALNDRLGRLEKTIEETRAKLSEPVRLEQPAPPMMPSIVAGFYVTDKEAELVREFLKVPPRNGNATAKMALWMRMPAQATRPLPDGLVRRFEKLKGLRYAVDANNAIALIEPSTNIVIALI